MDTNHGKNQGEPRITRIARIEAVGLPAKTNTIEREKQIGPRNTRKARKL
jgi:hypothetical protein